MKYIKIITVLLMFTLAISPALAASCAVSCATKTVIMSAVNTGDMSNMVNCHKNSKHQNSTNKPHNQTDTHQQSCTMGVGCHFVQATPTDSTTNYSFFALSSTLFPQFNVSAKSIDLSPPLKPPA